MQSTTCLDLTTPAAIAGALAIVALGLSSVATANAGELPPQERVSYQDLNLRTGSGQKVLKKRLRAAAERVCTPQVRRSLINPDLVDTCETEAFSRAWRSVRQSQRSSAVLLSGGS